MQIIQLYTDHNIPFQTEGNKHCRPDWVNTACPHCTGNIGLHLGYSLSRNYFKCWRCGWHPVIPTISRLAKISQKEAGSLVRQYGGAAGAVTAAKVVLRIKAHRLPSNHGPLQRQHKHYLRKRLFDPDKLEQEWKLLGTGPCAKLGESWYKNRIIIPIFWDRKRISFQSRSISNKAKPKYKACPANRELIPHKHILYGKQEAWGDAGICVEGPADVWRFGPNAFAISGIEFTKQQVQIMTTHFKRIAVVFDDDPQAQMQADKLVAELRFAGIAALRVNIVGDPAAMEQTEANYLVKHIMGG